VCALSDAVILERVHNSLAPTSRQGAAAHQSEETRAPPDSGCRIDHFVQAPRPQNALECSLPISENSIPEPTTRSPTVDETTTRLLAPPGRHA
jgi:hypothetical protein